MTKINYKYIYGPVSSWRLGCSLGVDSISGKVKICSFDCIYCQLGKNGQFSGKRKVFVPVEKIIREINSLPPLLKIDYITFSGLGEPTLARNLGRMIKAIKRVRKEKIAVLTNSSLIGRKDVQRDLSLADFVMAKLDVPSQELLEKVNRPVRGLKFKRMLKGITEFRARYKGKLALQIMFVKENKGYAGEIAGIARDIKPDEVQLNTPLRPCGLRPLSKKELNIIKSNFKGMKVVSIYDAKKKKAKSINREQTLRRRRMTGLFNN